MATVNGRGKGSADSELEPPELRRGEQENKCCNLSRKWIVVIAIAGLLLLGGIIAAIVVVVTDDDGETKDTVVRPPTVDYTKTIMRDILNMRDSDQQFQDQLCRLVNYQNYLLDASETDLEGETTLEEIEAPVPEAAEGVPASAADCSTPQTLARFEGNFYKLLGVEPGSLDGETGNLSDDVDLGARVVQSLSGTGGPKRQTFREFVKGLSTAAPYFALVDVSYEVYGLSLGEAALPSDVDEIRDAITEQTKQLTATLEDAASGAQNGISDAREELEGRLNDGEMVSRLLAAFVEPTDRLRQDLYAYKNGLVDAWNDDSFVGSETYCNFHAWCVGTADKPQPITLGRNLDRLIQNDDHGAYLVGYADAFVNTASAPMDVTRFGVDLLTRLGVLQQAVATCDSVSQLVSQNTGPEGFAGRCGSFEDASNAAFVRSEEYDELAAISTIVADFLDYELSTVLPAKRAFTDTFHFVSRGECELRREDEDSPTCGEFKCYWVIDVISVEIFEYYEAGPTSLRLTAVADRRGEDADMNDIFMQLPGGEMERLQDGERLCKGDVDDAFIDELTGRDPPEEIFTQGAPVNLTFEVGPQQLTRAYMLDDYRNRTGTVQLYIHTQHMTYEELAQNVPLEINFFGKCPDNPAPNFETRPSEEKINAKEADLEDNLRGSLITRNIKKFSLTCELILDAAAGLFAQVTVCFAALACLLLGM